MKIRYLLLVIAASFKMEAATVPNLQIDFSNTGVISNVVLNSTSLNLTGTGGFEIADFANQPATTNFILNPGFESGLTSWGISGNVVNDAVVYHSGTNSAHIDIPAGPASGAIIQTIVINPSTRYRISFWLRKSTTTQYGAYYQFQQSDGTPIGSQVNLNVVLSDNIWTQFSADITSTANTGKLYFYSSIYLDQGSLWMDDVSVVSLEKVFTPVTGTFSSGNFSGNTNNVLLNASIATNSTAILIFGSLTNLVTTNRAIAVKFKLPVVATNWVWHDDVLNSRQITNSLKYKNIISTELGDGERSVYPLGVLTDTTGTNNLVIAWPMSSSPRGFIIEYDNINQSLNFITYLGLSASASKFVNSGTFSLVVFPVISSYGFRAGLNGYYGLYPSSFSKRNLNEIAYNYGGNEIFTNNVLSLGGTGTYLYTNATDFGSGYGYMGTSLHGVAFDSYWITNSVTRPSDVAVRSWLPSYTTGQYQGSNALQQIMTDSGGAIRYTASAYDAGTTTWYLEYYVNQDPEITTALTSSLDSVFNSFFATYRSPYSITISSDFACGSDILNYNTNHMTYTDFPLTFGNASNSPAIMSGLWDFYSQYLYPKSQTYKFTIMGNTGSSDILFVAPFIDVQMIEGIRTTAEYYSYRAFAKSKIVRNWTTIATTGGAIYTEAEFISELMNCLRLAIYPSLGTTLFGNMTETFRPFYKVYIPVIDRLSKAGWEPVNYASATSSAVVERFGNYGSNNLYFSVANTTTNNITTAVTIDRTGLAIPSNARLLATELIVNQSLNITSNVFSVNLTNSQTKAVYVSGTTVLQSPIIRAGKVKSK